MERRHDVPDCIRFFMHDDDDPIPDLPRRLHRRPINFLPLTFLELGFSTAGIQIILMLGLERMGLGGRSRGESLTVALIGTSLRSPRCNPGSIRDDND